MNNWIPATPYFRPVDSSIAASLAAAGRRELNRGRMLAALVDIGYVEPSDAHNVPNYELDALIEAVR